MQYNKENQEFVDYILSQLQGMEGLQIDQNDHGIISVTKNGVKIGEIAKSRLRLINKENKYILVDKSVVTDKDNLLREATNAFWIATGTVL